RLLDELDALGDVEHRRLVLRVVHDAHDNAVEDTRGARDHIDVTVRHGVIGPGIDGGDHVLSNSVRRADPYLREVRTSRPGTSGGSSRPADSKTRRPSSARSRASCGTRRDWS